MLHIEPARQRAEHLTWSATAALIERDLRQLAPAALFETAVAQIRALLSDPAVPPDEPRALCGALVALAVARGVVIGRSNVRGADLERGRREAADAAQVAQLLAPEGGSMSYRELGAYRYLVRIPPDQAPCDYHAEAVIEIMAYDRRRQAELLKSLEEYVSHGRSITATARALIVHPNTLRQRLRRIEQITGLELASEDALSLELAVKLARLRPSGA